MLYTVRYGDSLNSVARAHRVSPAELSSINQLDPHIKPVPGQSLIIPDDNEPSKPIAIHGSVLPGTGDMAFLCAAPYLTYVSVRSGRFLPDGSIIGINDHSLIRRAYGFSTAPLLTVTNQRQGGEYSGELLHGLLQSEGAKAAFSDKLTAYLSCRNYKGVNLDFSSICSLCSRACQETSRQRFCAVHNGAWPARGASPAGQRPGQGDNSPLGQRPCLWTALPGRPNGRRGGMYQGCRRIDTLGQDTAGHPLLRLQLGAAIQGRHSPPGIPLRSAHPCPQPLCGYTL